MLYRNIYGYKADMFYKTVIKRTISDQFRQIK